MEWGTLQGLAQSAGFDKRIEDAKYFEQQRKQKEAMDIAKNKMFLDDVEFQNASNPYDAAIIKEEGKNVLAELGRLRRENPNWASDPNVLGQMKLVKSGLKSSPAVLRSIAYKDYAKQYGDFLQDAAKNPNKYNEDDLMNAKARMENYAQYGHPEGEAGFNRDGAQALVFTAPDAIPDFTEIHRKVGDSINPDKYEALKNGRDGAYIGYVDDKTLTNKAVELYSKDRKNYDYVYKKQGLDPIEAIKASLRPFVKTDYDIGNRNPLADQMALESYKMRLKTAAEAQKQGKEFDPYQHVILNSEHVKTDPSDLARTYGTKVPYYYKDATGKLVKGQGDDFNYEGDIYDKNLKKDASGKIIPYNKDGVKVTPGFVYKSLDWADKQGYLKDAWGWGTNDEVADDFKDIVEIVTTPPNKDGESKKVVKLKAFNEVNANSPEYTRKYNKGFSTTKQREGYGTEESMLDRQVYQDEKGNKFVLDANGNPTPY